MPSSRVAAPEAKKLPPTSEEQKIPAARVRKAVVAGSWYPAEKEKLAAVVDDFLTKADTKKVEGKVMALISPHAGYAFSGKAAATGYKLLRGQDIRRVVILALSHHVPFHGASILDVTDYETPLGLIPVDREAVARLRRCRVVKEVIEADRQEHSLEMQLPFLQRVLPRFSLVPIVIGRMEEQDFKDLAAALAEVVDEKTLVVASSDFTHRGPNYGYEPPLGPEPIQQRLTKLDQGAIDRILKLDREELLLYHKQTGATICGINPIAVLLELLSRFKGARGQVVSHYTSGDVTGDWSSTVTYVSLAFTGAWPKQSSLEMARSAGEAVFPLSRSEKQTLLRLARASLAASVRKGSFDTDGIRGIPSTTSLQRRAGAFVTLKCKLGPGSVCVGRGEDLRGCIGTIAPLASVYDTVAQRAASAALEDPRFPQRVGVHELEKITVEVSVLTPPHPVKRVEEIIVGRHGIILEKDGQSATFLPQVAPEQGWDRETTLTHLALKAGLSAYGWRDGASFSVYEAIVFSEDELN